MPLKWIFVSSWSSPIALGTIKNGRMMTRGEMSLRRLVDEKIGPKENQDGRMFWIFHWFTCSVTQGDSLPHFTTQFLFVKSGCWHLPPRWYGKRGDRVGSGGKLPCLNSHFATSNCVALGKLFDMPVCLSFLIYKMRIIIVPMS